MTACAPHPSGRKCIADALWDINRARRAEGMGPMVLPRGFASLTVPWQLLVLSNLERADRGLPPVGGLSAPLNHDAAVAASAEGNDNLAKNATITMAQARAIALKAVPGTVAAAHYISVRYLYRLFDAQGTTVAAWIRPRRLERCRVDLADPLARIIPYPGSSADSVERPLGLGEFQDRSIVDS